MTSEVASVVVRRVTPADGALLREVRLRALQDTPEAFSSTYEDEAQRPQPFWDERARNASAGNNLFSGLALLADEAVGLIGGFRNDEDGHHADIDLVSMWVAPSHRGTGVAAALVEAVLDWARDDAAAEIVGLWVTRGNDRAQRFYERLGFVETGDVQPLPSDPCRDEVRMVFGLRAPSSAR